MTIERRTNIRVSWICVTCATAEGCAPTYPGGPDEFCCACRRALDPTERLAAAVTILLRRTSGGPGTAASSEETCGVADAARLLHTTPQAVYTLHSPGKLPPTIGPGRRLLWRRTDLLDCKSTRASSPERNRR